MAQNFKANQNKLPQLSSKEYIPIDVTMALAKEKLLVQQYFGTPNVAAHDFIDSALDSVLAVQLLSDKPKEECIPLVRNYLANYVNWATAAQLHSIQAKNKVCV